jgi:hypothetical protein
MERIHKEREEEMNLQRREEIRAIAECPNDRHWAQEMRRAVAELLAHIDALEQTAAERVIADGSRGPTPDYTGEGSAWVPPVEARAVVAPELTDEQMRELILNAARRCGCVDFDPEDVSAGDLEIAREIHDDLTEAFSAVSADRVLGDGMVAAMDDALLPSARTKAIHMGEYSFMIMDSDGNGNEIPRKIDVPWTTVKEIMRAIRSDALRANQGGV